jgi:hypothetical protein
VLYNIYKTKPDYNRAFKAARRYILKELYKNKEGEEEKQLLLMAARIFYIKEDSL